MKAVWFRFINEDGKPTAWHGLAVGKNATELFWEIDEYGDPYSCEIIDVKNSASVCFKIEDDYFFDEINVAETNVFEDLFINNNWKKPVWPRNLHKTKGK